MNALLAHQVIIVRLLRAPEYPIAPFLAKTVVTVLEDRLVALFVQLDMHVNQPLQVS